MKPIFRVIEVFRVQHRRGPILVGQFPPVDITVGTRLVAVHDADQVAEVIAIDFPPQKVLAENRLAVVVQPDLGEAFRPGAGFFIINPDA